MMNIFRQFFNTAQEIKQSAVGPLLTVYTSMRPLWSGRDYKAYAEEGYQKNIIAFSCINKIQSSIKYIPINLMQKDKKIEDHPILDLIKKPNPRQTSTSLIESLAGFIMVSGNGYLEMVPQGTDPTQICTNKRLPVELYVHRTDLIKIMPDAKGQIFGYQFEYNSKPFTWKVDPLSQACNIIHIKTWNPTDFWYGQSPLQAAAMSVDTHNEATIWNQAMLQNSGKPSGALNWKPANAASNITPEQRQAVKEQLDQAITGSKNSGRPLILDGDWTWTQMGLSPADMDWLNSKTTSAKEVCMALGTPPYLMGITDPTYNNAREARAMMYEDTIIPLLEMILEYLNQFLCPLYGDDFHLEADLNKIQALSPRRQETWTMVNSSTCLTTNEKRGLLGFELVDDPAADEIMVNSTIVPLSTKLDPPEPEQVMVDENGDPIPGNEDDPDSDADDDLSPGREGAPQDDDQTTPPNPPNPPAKNGPKNPAGGKAGGKKPVTTTKGGRFNLDRKRIEKSVLRAILMKEFKYDDKSAKDMADFAWGSRGR